MLVLPGAEVDHVPTVSGTSGQSPLTLETVANWIWSSGGAARWSEMALKGDTMAVMLQLFCGAPPQPNDDAKEYHRQKQDRSFHRTLGLNHADSILWRVAAAACAFVPRATPVKDQASRDCHDGAPSSLASKIHLFSRSPAESWQRSWRASVIRNPRRSRNPDSQLASWDKDALVLGAVWTMASLMTDAYMYRKGMK